MLTPQSSYSLVFFIKISFSFISRPIPRSISHGRAHTFSASFPIFLALCTGVITSHKIYDVCR